MPVERTFQARPKALTVFSQLQPVFNRRLSGIGAFRTYRINERPLTPEFSGLMKRLGVNSAMIRTGCFDLAMGSVKSDQISNVDWENELARSGLTAELYRDQQTIYIFNTSLNTGAFPQMAGTTPSRGRSKLF
jgi:hypothetical protein